MPRAELHRRPIVEFQGRWVSTAGLPATIEMPQSPASKAYTVAGLALVTFAIPPPCESNQHLAQWFPSSAAPIQRTANPGHPQLTLPLPTCGGKIRSEEHTSELQSLRH